MSTQDNNLLTFLKKQSLFSNSPSKNMSRKRSSKSKDKNNQAKPEPVKINQGLSFDDNFIKSKPLKLASEHNFNAYQNDSNRYAPIQANNQRFNNPLHDSRFNSFEQLQDRRDMRNPENREQGIKNNEVWAGLVSFTTSFQSARIQSSQCLQNLGNKVRGEIANINYKIDNFNSKMHKVISNEFKNLKERIYLILEESFKESERYIREYMKTQEDKLAAELILARDSLQKEATKIEGMRQEINKPNWRKVAGQIIASELETKIESILKQSNALEIGRWQLGDLVGYRLKDLERDIKDVVRLKRQI